MKRKQIARALARQQKTPVAPAQDEVDELVYGILEKLRAGRSVRLPGLGKLAPAALRSSSSPRR